MPKYIVTEERAYTARMLIESQPDPATQSQQDVTVIDQDNGDANDHRVNITIEQVDDATTELPPL